MKSSKNKKKDKYNKSYRTHLMKNYGITPEEYLWFLQDQGFKCAICGKTVQEEGKRLAVDHCHKTGEVRGLLCTSCNLGLGSFKDNPESLLNAVDYLFGIK